MNVSAQEAEAENQIVEQQKIKRVEGKTKSFEELMNEIDEILKSVKFEELKIVS